MSRGDAHGIVHTFERVSAGWPAQGCDRGRDEHMTDRCDIGKLNRLRLTESVTGSG